MCSGRGRVVGPDLFSVKRVDVLRSVLVVSSDIAQRVRRFSLDAVENSHDVLGDKVEEDDVDLVRVAYVLTGDRALNVVGNRSEGNSAVHGVVSIPWTLVLGDVAERAVRLSFSCSSVQYGQVTSCRVVSRSKNVLILEADIDRSSSSTLLPLAVAFMICSVDIDYCHCGEQVIVAVVAGDAVQEAPQLIRWPPFC